jgi:hypothetical protein
VNKLLKTAKQKNLAIVTQVPRARYWSVNKGMSVCATLIDDHRDKNATPSKPITKSQ